MHVTKSEN